MLADLGASLHRGGKEEEAIKSFEESLRLLRATGERWGIAYALLWLGDAWFRMGDPIAPPQAGKRVCASPRSWGINP